MKIEKIDDRGFREEAVRNFHWHDSSRRFEIHFTDLINCLLCSVKHKVLPNDDEGDPEESYTQVLDWVGGLGFDNLITERISGKTTTWIDGAQGNVDMIFKGIPYELTSTLYLSRKVKESNDLGGFYQYKQEQLRLYMAGIGKTTGKLKIIERAGERRKDPSGKPYGRPRPKEHTWRVTMTPLELARKRLDVIRRKNFLVEALATGSITKLFELRDMLCPILKSSFCAGENGYCKEFSLFQGKDWYVFRRKWKEWITIALDGAADNPSALALEMRRWM